MACPNINLDSWKNLVTARGEDVAYALWDKYDGNVPESESRESIVKSGLKATSILQSPKADQFFNSVIKNKISGDFFWKKMQADLGIPKEQVELLKQYNTTDREQLITNMLADYSFAVEINLSTEGGNVGKNQGKAIGEARAAGLKYGTKEFEDFVKNYLESKGEVYVEKPSQYYANLTVPGGTNYTENEIATPAITPSIKGHAQFATDKGIGWFRSDDKAPIVEGFAENKEAPSEWGIEDAVLKEEPKTRRILEVQSDLFQKGRDRKDLISKKPDNSTDKIEKQSDGTWAVVNTQVGIIESGFKTQEEADVWLNPTSKENQFLQLLNQGSNWVTFFVKSIIQDSAKKGYEKVLFPSGNTASKIEGHSTLEEFKKQKEARLKQINEQLTKGEVKENFKIEQRELYDIRDLRYTVRIENTKTGTYISTEFKTKEEAQKWIDDKGNPTYEIKINLTEDELNIYQNNLIEKKALEQELERVETEGFGALKPIYNFYETTVANVLKKQGYAPKQVTDEYGNTWNEVEIVSEREQQSVLLQKEEMPMSKASTETLNKVKEAARKMGVDIQELADYAKGNPDMDTKGVNGLADLTRGVIALAEGKEGVALTEELVHIARSILQQTNPKLVTEMISKIDRFKIYKETLDKYKNNKNYQLPNGKPDIRKIKMEAVDKLIAEVIINDNENIEQYPELREEINQSLIRSWWNTILDWIRGIYRKSNISLFEEAAAQIVAGEIGTVADITEGGLMFQLSDNQKTIQEKIFATQDEIEKVVEDETKVEPVLLDSEEARNYYRRKKPDGTFETIEKRVTDRVKAWYKRKFGDKQFTPEEKKFNELKRDLGIQGHKDLENIHARYFHKDGTRRTSPEPRPTKFSNLSEEMYDKLEKYFTDLLDTLDPKTIVLSEVIVYDKKNKEAGTIDFLAIEPSGKAHILDWKFMHIKGDDVAWFKQGAFNIQLGTYKKMLRENYGIKEFGMTRAIPIAMEFKLKNPRDPKSGSYLGGIAIGSVDVSKIEDLRLVPISEETESTGFEALDEILRKMNGLLAQIGKEEVGDEEEREFKIERLNTLRKAIRLAQTTMNIAPLIDVIEVMRKEGDRILEDYNTIYKNRSARSSDSKNDELSDFADDMNNYIKLSDIFVNIGRKIGTLVYTPQMEAEATTEEEKANVAQRKEVLRKLREESDAIYDSREAINKASMAFADKHIGERNLTFGLLKPEKVLKGLASMFRGAADISLRSVEILTKLVNNAQSLAAKNALSEVGQLMSIREKLAKRGGDLRKLVQQVYQKDDKGKIVNKLIYKYKREFFSEVDEKAEDGGDKNWILQNIDVEAYKKEAEEKLKDQIKKIQGNRYAGTPEEEKATRERLIEEAKRKWDIDRIDFDGWKNHIIKRHPLAKWYSEEYKNLQKDPELMELYNFIVKFNNKAEDTGYISNQMSKIFLPFVRKSMAEELVWDNRLSVMDNFYKSIQLNPDDTGYGEFNEVTGALENSIPKYYTKDFTFKDGVNDYSDVSEDLFKNLILYIQQVNKYKYLTDVEGQLKLVKTIEEFKSHLNTDRIGNVVYENGKPKEIEGNERNTKIYDDFLRVMLYDQKYVIDDSDLPFNIGKVLNFVKDGVNKVAGKEIWKKDEDPKPSSLIKTIDAANRAFQLKTLGFEFISGAVNMFGGNIQLSTQAGNYFKAREFAKNEAKLTFQRFDNNEDKEMFVQLINTFMPLKDDPSYEMYKQAGMSKLTQGNLSDTLMFFMRQPEILIEKSVFLTLLQNSMVVNGQIVNIREYVRNKYKSRYDSAASYNAVKDDIENEIEELKKTKSIDKTKKLVDGKLEIPGLDLNNIEELQRLTNLSRRMAANATGSMTKENINRMSMSVWTKSMMVFKNWIPKLIDTRFGEFRKVVDDFSVRVTDDGSIEGQKYDIGRIRLLTHVLGDGIITGAANLKNILYLNDAGLERLDQMFEEFREKYELETGEKLNMSREDFIDLIRTNLRNQVKELAILVSLMGVLLSLGFVAPDDDEDKATKNFHRYSQKVFGKFADELLFFYTPSGISGTLSGGIFPALGLTEDIGRFTKHFAMETTGMDLDPQTSIEDVRKKAQPIKNLMKVAPVTKSLVTYLAIFNEDFAREFDVTIQKESGR